MTAAAELMWVIIACGALAAAMPGKGSGAEETMNSSTEAGYTDISVRETPEHEVRFTSGKAVYVEGLVGDHWVGRYWAADGRIGFPDWRSSHPAFELQIRDDPNGTARVVAGGWQWKSAAEAPKTDRGARHFVVELSNTIHPISVRLHTVLDGTPVLTRWLEVTNHADRSVALIAVSPWSSWVWSPCRFGPAAFRLLYQTPPPAGAICVGYEWKPLPPGPTVVESVEGNGFDDPFFMVQDVEKGEYVIGHLVWSANWRLELENSGDLSFKMGPSAKDALRVIAPSETIETPALHLGHIEGDLDAAVQAMHDHIRRFVLPRRNPRRAYLIQLDTMGDLGYFKFEAFNEANVRKCIDLSAAIGAELFLLDCPWYDVYGDWVPSRTRFPRGLKPLVEYAHSKGLLFGLQTEVEAGRNVKGVGEWNQSKVKREHPDWFGPNNVMYLDRPEVAAYMESELARVIDEYQPDLYRNEYIPEPLHLIEFASTLRDGFMENNYWRHYDNWNRVWERLRAKYPDLVWQQCACGGAREDLGAMSRFDESYTNEAPPILALPAYSGKTLALPPEALVIGLGTAPDRGHLHTHLRLQFTLTTPQIVTGPAPTVEELSPELRQRWLHYADLYQRFIRPLLPACKVYHHEPVNARGGSTSSPWFAMEYAAPDRSRGWATIVRLGESESDTYVFKPRGLSPATTYQVTFDSMGETATVSGLDLVRQGLPIRLEAVMSSELLLFQAQ